MILLFFPFFAIGEGVPGINTSHEPVAQATRVETVGLWLMMLGLVIGWKWEGLAAISILAGAMEFHIVEWRFLMGPLDWPLLVGALMALLVDGENTPAAPLALPEQAARRRPMVTLSRRCAVR